MTSGPQKNTLDLILAKLNKDQLKRKEQSDQLFNNFAKKIKFNQSPVRETVPNTSNLHGTSEKSSTGKSNSAQSTDNKCLLDLVAAKTDNLAALKWKKISNENLNLDYTVLFPHSLACQVFNRLEDEVQYFSGDLLKVQIFGKWHTIPRKQVSYGDPGLSYKFSGNSIPALPWTPLMLELRDVVTKLTDHTYNFVLINRYKDGNDHMGEHRDDEKDLDPNSPIISLSFGQPRDFIFRHKDARGKNALKKIEPVKLVLENGSLLVMKPPTNNFWYHSLPIRKRAMQTRINLTFRKMIVK
ncbi:DNA oxidative demethylase ALKBH2-like isoform X2 [Limulus polyphemus]|uniref:DNA oxidative demethylase ALKBH2-like isoform X2 n=1 Tax=Limulus polyphemus TaxID=6850 RepID=A0ABM1BPN2_LIMPO|nr:DNA oxidative demethylase ALKBH2-like isoform X2 [Limulus polyphemus]